MRALADVEYDPENQPVYASSSEELELGILQGFAHIIVTNHLDLTSLPSKPTTACLDGCESPLPEVRLTQVIRGNCTPPSHTDVAVLNQTLGAAGLLPLQEHQCLIFSSDDAIYVHVERFWLDNLYFRVVHSPRSPRPREIQFVSLAGFAPMTGSNAGLGQRWVTRTTFQGDGLGPAVGIWASEATYIENCTFANLGGDELGYCDVCTSAVNVQNTSVAIVNSTFFDPVPIDGTAYVRTWDDGRVLVSGCEFADTPEFYTPFQALDTATIYSNDRSIKIREQIIPWTGSVFEPTPVSQIPDFPVDSNMEFVWRTDEWFLRTTTFLNLTVPRQPAYAAPTVSVPPLGSPSDPWLASLQALGPSAIEPQAAVPTQPADVSPLSRTDDRDSSVSAATVAMIVVPVGVLLLTLCALCFLLRRRQLRKRRSPRHQARKMASPGVDTTSTDDSTRPDQPHPWEELATTESRAIERLQRSNLNARKLSRRAPRTKSNTPSLNVSESGPAVEPVLLTGASLSENVARMDAQLDAMVPGSLVLEQFKLVGQGARRHGRQSIVAFATGAYADIPYVIKFFAMRESFNAELATRRDPAMGALAPDIHAVHDPSVGAAQDNGIAITDPLGRTLPPFIVMPRAESLDEWTRRASADVFQAVSVLSHVSTCVRDIHAANYVHGDVKPAHIVHLRQENRWKLTDFDRAAVFGAAVPLDFTLTYAAPELVAASDNGQDMVAAHPAVDCWAMGVVAFELLTGQQALDSTGDREAVEAQLRGSAPLPWEGARQDAAVEQKLGVFRDLVLALLRRDPTQRATMHAFCSACLAIFAATTTGATVTHQTRGP